MPAREAGLIRIEYMPLSSRKAARRNPKQHALEDIKNSIRRFGYVMPAALNETSGSMVAGHGRTDALAEMKAAGEEPPKRILERDGEWFFPVLRGLDFDSEEEAEAYLVADNKLTELGGYDETVLAQMLQEQTKLLGSEALRGLGIDERESARLLAALEGGGSSGHGGTDEAPAPPAEPISKRGELWLLGDHRIMCGDSTCVEDVARLLGGEVPHLMVTDPPYGVEYDADWRNHALRSDGSPIAGRAIGKVANDDRCDWSAAWALFPGSVAYVWHAFQHASEVQDSLRRHEFEVRWQIIWAKNNFAIGRGDYHPQHECCWYVVKKGSTSHYNGDRTQTTLWEIPKPQKSETGHSTQKPVECMARPIRNNSKAGESIYEPFSGSGTTIIAAEQLGRRCYAMELEPRYVDVAVARWEKFTGKTAIKS